MALGVVIVTVIVNAAYFRRPLPEFGGGLWLQLLTTDYLTDIYKQTITNRQLQTDNYKQTITNRQLQTDNYKQTITKCLFPNLNSVE